MRKCATSLYFHAKLIYNIRWVNGRENRKLDRAVAATRENVCPT